ncbi:MAG: hypothetical protein HOK49_15080 [Opitutae bacterium]|nr:hypothetical protein [Opitutae bacterium]MBT5690183.1 hypothetical protein [Opitutae bacterium]MBT6463839.1 hypothetical protein [Opitutae bacterium]
MKTTEDKVPWSLLLLVAGVYMLSAKGLIEISDTDYSLRTAQALVEQGTFLIDPPDPDFAKVAPKIVDGKIYSKYGVGLVIIFLPIVILSKGIALIPGASESITTGFLISFYNVPFAILSLCFFHKICIILGAKTRGATLATLILAIGTFFWKYTVTDYSEITQLFFLLGTAYYLLRGKGNDSVKASMMFSCLLLLKVVNIIIWGPCALYLILRHGGVNKESFHHLIRFGSIVFLTGLGLLLYNHLRFGTPWETGYSISGANFTLANFKRDFLDYFISPQRGVFAFNPVLLVPLAFWPALYKAKRNEAIFLISTIVLWFLLMASWVSYQGGWSWGNRLLLPIIPFLLIPVSLMKIKMLWQKISLSLIFIVSLYIQVIAVFQHTQEYFVIIRDLESNPGVQAVMPPQLKGNAILFHQKLAGNSGEYPLDIFIDQDEYRDSEKDVLLTKDYETYQGLHAWPFHLATFMKQSILGWLMLPILPLLFFLLINFHKIANQSGAPEPEWK